MKNKNLNKQQGRQVETKGKEQIEKKQQSPYQFFSLVVGKFFEGLRNLSIATAFGVLYLTYKEVGTIHFMSNMALGIVIIAISLNTVKLVWDIIDTCRNWEGDKESCIIVGFSALLIIAFTVAISIILSDLSMKDILDIPLKRTC
ncbi:hypothetical protein ACLSZ7_02790 [Avibacterium gallinarum]|uniref:hypothetical protein n=1 Tax=Avibacterium gallinarum TaxID=755 RepID=UPI003BF83AAD